MPATKDAACEASDGRGRIRAVRVIVALLFVGCSTSSDALRSRFATERSCPKDDVRVEQAGSNQYRASGCSQQAVYVCGASAGFGDPGSRCVEQGAERRSPPERGGPRVPPPDPRIQEPR